MKPFRYVEAESIAQATGLLQDDHHLNQIIAGGTDIMGEIMEGVVSPATLVSLMNMAELKGVVATPQGLRLGAFTTLTELESHPDVIQSYPALAQAIASIATPQIRNVGTLGGNLCQRPRCWYYRNPLFDCRKKGGAICFAISGNSKYHAILGARDCYIVHPSDVAVALVSLQAEATITSPDGFRTVPLEEFFVGPDFNILAETVLQPGEILTSVSVPKVSPNHRSIYLKVRERQTQDFALVSVALALELDDGVVHNARITLGGVAPVPFRVPHAEAALQGLPVGQVDPQAVGELAIRDSQPIRDNHFKVGLTSSLVSRAVRMLLEADRVT